MYVCMFEKNVCMYVWKNVCMYICMKTIYVCKYVRKNVSMYLCMKKYMYICIKNVCM